MLHATHSFSTTRTIAQVGREMVSWKSYGIVERDVSNKDFSRSIITGSENRGGRKRKVLLCCIYTPISCSISIAGTDHRFFFFFFSFLFFSCFFCFRTWQNFLCFNLILLIGREKRRTSEKNEYRCAVMLTRLECRWTSNNQSKREDRK